MLPADDVNKGFVLFFGGSGGSGGIGDGEDGDGVPLS